MADSWQFGRLASRRLTSRVSTPEGVWAYWRCEGREDVSAIQDMSMGGVFLKTLTVKPVGTKVHLHFLIPEGLVRADAEIRHLRTGAGLGMKFTAVAEEDRPRMAALMSRLRSSARTRTKTG